MTARIEARRLSGEHVGRWVTVPDASWSSARSPHEAGELLSFDEERAWAAGREQYESRVAVTIQQSRSTLTRYLAPTDLVTIHDDRTTTPTPKETL